MTLPTLYQFADLSHWESGLPGQALADIGHRIAVRKASDNYNMPDKDGKYYWNPERHYDAWFLDGVRSDLEAGLAWVGFHFARYDRPLPLAGEAAIVQANFDNYMDSLQMLVNEGIVTQEQLDSVICACFDSEQSASQLQAAGRSRAKVSSMTKDMIGLYLERFPNLIFYSGSWWTDQWIDDSTMEWIAERTTCWEPQYVSIKGAEGNYWPDPTGGVDWYIENHFTIPHGFQKEFATSADDAKGKIFAWQYTDAARVPGYSVGVDFNLTAMSKGELFKFTGTDGSVDPPNPDPDPDPGDCSQAVLDGQLAILDGIIQSLQDMRNEMQA